MDENMIDAAEINRITYLNKKRKIQGELPKHVCWAQKIEYSSTAEQKKARISMFAVGEPVQENPNEIGSSSRNEASSSFKSETIIREELDRLYRDYGLDPSDFYEDELPEFGNHNNIDNKDLDLDLDLDLDDVVASPSNYVILSVDHQGADTLEESKQTIDKEFEEYFSMLML